MIDPLESLLGYQLRRASAVMMADLGTSLAPLDLRPTEASVLLAIMANTDATQSDIGRLLGIKRANMTPIVAMLSERGFVDRTASDGRSQFLHLTAAGTTVTGSVRAAIDRHERRFLADLPAAARASLIERLQMVRKRHEDR